jgi:hypothetical protein
MRELRQMLGSPCAARRRTTIGTTGSRPAHSASRPSLPRRRTSGSRPSSRSSPRATRGWIR